MEDNYDISMRNWFGFLFNYKRFFLPTTIMLPLMTISEIFQNDFYIFFSSFISLMIFGWNFPSISRLYYSKPIYFDDLDDNNENTKKNVHNRILYNIELSSKFKLKFIIFQQLIISLTLSIIIEYITIKYKRENGLSKSEKFLKLKDVKHKGNYVQASDIKIVDKDTEKEDPKTSGKNKPFANPNTAKNIPDFLKDVTGDIFEGVLISTDDNDLKSSKNKTIKIN